MTEPIAMPLLGFILVVVILTTVARWIALLVLEVWASIKRPR